MRQVGWIWETGSDPFSWTEFRTVKDMSRHKANELHAKAVYADDSSIVQDQSNIGTIRNAYNAGVAWAIGIGMGVEEYLESCTK